eukprot:1087753-Prymnesium_polylepis.1
MDYGHQDFEDDDFDEEAAAALDELESGPAVKKPKTAVALAPAPPVLAPAQQAPAVGQYTGLASSIDFSEEAELRRLESGGADPAPIDLTVQETSTPPIATGD